MYTILPRNRLFLAVQNICRSEIHPGNTVTFLSEVDLSAIEARRQLSEKRGEVKPSYTSFVVKAVALALKEFPYANCRAFRFPWGRRVIRFASVDIAVATERDLPEAPMLAFLDVIREADGLNLSEITLGLRALAAATVDTNRQWRLFYLGILRFPAWVVRLVMITHTTVPALWCRYRGGACVVSSPAKYGVDQVIGSWTHPLGVSFGQVKWSLAVSRGEPVLRKTFTFSLNFDRTVMAGAQAAKFFKRVTALLETAADSQKAAPELFADAG